jgi:hypothetical protein
MKHAKFPIIAICNNRQDQKVRTLAAHCYDLKFQRPGKAEIAVRIQQVARAEMRESFIAEAQAAAVEIDAGAAVYAAEEVHAYLVSRLSGGRIKRPRPLAGR